MSQAQNLNLKPNEWYRSQFDAKNSSRPSLASEVRVVRDTVNQTGRCPSLAGRLRPSSKAWLDILLLPPTGVSQNHSMCRILHCQLNDVKKDEYQVRHAESCSGCELQSADQPALVTAINGDRIPLVSCFLDSNAILRFKIVEGDLNFKYTAISHVWTGGLGNYERNALPSCQLAYLWSISQRDTRHAGHKRPIFSLGSGDSYRGDAVETVRVAAQ